MSRYIRECEKSYNSLLWKTGFAIICIYLAAAFPGTQLFGSFPMQRISLLLLLGHGAITIAFSIKNGLYSTTHILWYGMFTALSFFSLIQSGDGLNNSDFYSVIICFVLTVIQSFYITNKQSFKNICWCYIIICLVNIFILIINRSLVLRVGERLGENLNINSNVLATYLMYGIIYAVFLFFLEKDKRVKTILLCTIILISYPLILTGGRKFFIAPVLFIIIVFIMNSDTKKGNKRLRNILVIGVSLAAIWYLIMNIPALYNSLGSRLEGLFNSYTGRGETESSAEARKQLRQLAIQGWLNSPVWGHGFDTFKYCSLSNGFPLFYSHCNITELLYNGGLVQFCAYYWFFAMVIWQCIVNKKIKKTVRSCCAAGIMMQFFFDYGGVSYNMYETQLFILMIYTAMNLYTEEKVDTI